MKTKAELQQDILNIAMKIQIEFPELTKHIKEMPSLFLSKEHDRKHIETLELYYNKLKSVLVENSRTYFNLEPNTGTEVLSFSTPPRASISNDARTYGKVEMQIKPDESSKNKIQDIISSEEKDFRKI